MTAPACAPRPWAPWYVGPVPRETTHPFGNRGYLAGVTRTWGNGWFAVMARPVATPWGEVQHVMIRDLPNNPVRDWRDLMRIKDELFGADRVAVEVYPRRDDVIDEANMTHLWVLPEGMELPFGLHPAAMHPEGALAIAVDPSRSTPHQAGAT